MQKITIRLLIVFSVMGLSTRLHGWQVPVDPAPPVVHAPDGRAAATAAASDELTRHAEPRPSVTGAATGDWQGLLGPTQNGHSLETGLRTDFDADPPTLLWSYATGHGYAQPAIAEGRVVFTHRISGEVHIDCLDPVTGERYWRHTHPCAYRGDYIPDNGPRSAPVIADGRVFVHSVEGRLFCFDLETGQVLWERDPTAEFEVGDHFFGVVSSPIVRGSVLIQNLGAPAKLGGASVVGFDVATGRIAWAAGASWGPSCASPVLGMIGGQERLCVLGGGKTRPATGGLMILDPDAGTVLHEYPFRSRTYESVLGANPVIGDDSVYVTASYNTGTARVALGGDGVFRQVWKSRRLGSQFSTPLFVDGHLYVIDGVSDRAGAIVCLEPGTGEERSRTDLVWDETVVHRGAPRTVGMSIGEGSMLYVQGRALVLGDRGHLLWVDLDPGGATVRARTSLFRANETWTPPALSQGLLYVCQNRREQFGSDPQSPRLMCFDMRAASE